MKKYHIYRHCSILNATLDFFIINNNTTWRIKYNILKKTKNKYIFFSIICLRQNLSLLEYIL